MPEYGLQGLVFRCLNELLPSAALQGGEISDLKGRDFQSVIDPGIPPEYMPVGEELAFAAGRVYLDPDDLVKGAPKSGGGEPWELRLSSTFKEFSGTHHITHRSSLARRGELPQFVALADIATAVPVRLERFRLGLELFQSRFLYGMLGYTPTVSQSLLIEADEKRIFLKIFAEALKAPDVRPLQADGLFEKLSAILRDELGFDLEKEYGEQTTGI